ncbi:MAG: hypothetical protein ACLR5X_06850 [Oscillospiraceae bacterium]|nr:hypothetical protein [Clostridiales bacterium]
MSEVQQLETSVMVTERNWSALLEMQDRLFRQQMQLNADLKTLLTKQEAQEALTAMQASATEFAGQAGSLNARYSSACKELTNSARWAMTTILDDAKKQLSDTTQKAAKKIRLCAWVSITAVILCAALCSLVVLWSR